MLDGRKTNLSVKVRGNEDIYFIITNACTKLQWVKISIRQRENQALTSRSADWEWVPLPWREPQTGGKVLSHMQSALTPTLWDNAISHSLTHRQTYVCVMHPSRLWHLLWCHQYGWETVILFRLTKEPQLHLKHTHTHTHHSTPWVSMPPPHHSSLSFLPWHQPGSLHKLHLYRTISCSVAPWGLCLLTLPAAQSRSLGLSLFVVLQLDYPITNGKYLGKWGLNIFAIWSLKPY